MGLLKAEIEAADKKRGLTLFELRAFLADAMRADLPDETPLQVLCGWHGQVTKLWTK